MSNPVAPIPVKVIVDIDPVEPPKLLKPIVKVNPAEPPKLLKPIVKINNLEPEPVRLQLADVLAALKNQREHWPDRSAV
jgi:hypothetical protein